ncbi:MAG: response regulator [Gammaproteobacteria bacterium]|nr:response regulator [Gammaproteobacteria bacterium]
MALFKRSGSKEVKGGGDAPAGGGETILVVDDSPTEVHVIKTIVEDGGYQVVTAVDGESGVEEAKRTLPDLILMDVVMPGLNGFQATRQLSKEPTTAHIPIILVTTKDQDTDRAWGLRQGAREYVVKPVLSAELLHKIKSLLS